MRRFNVTGLCVPKKHYMVDISGKLEQIKEMIDRGEYFTINRARQYGKTTTLHELEKKLENEYTVISISFEGVGDESFVSPETFCPMFLRQIVRALAFAAVDEEYKSGWLDESVINFEALSHHITKMCKDRKLVLMIDEVDKTSNNRAFLHFLGILRDKYLSREKEKDYTFQSVILAGVYDIRNIKLKMIKEGSYKLAPQEDKIYNSPWNIAINFKVDMSFSAAEIETMLVEYETDHNTGMDIAVISDEIYKYTSGYPFLVSRICQCIDKELDKDWTADGGTRGVQNAVKIILDEKNTLFDDLFKNLENDRDLYDFAYAVLFAEPKNFVINDPLIEMGVMFGFFKSNGGKVAVSNKIFELVMANYFISKESRTNPDRQIKNVLQYDIVKNGRFDMELCLRKFAEHYAEMFSESDVEFLERHGRLLFLSYLRPLINGQGFYHIESQFTDLRRMDIVVDFGEDQFIIELKVWNGVAERNHRGPTQPTIISAVADQELSVARGGDKYKEEAYKQLLGYMNSKNAGTGYMLTFDFRKGVTKQTSAQWVNISEKRILDVTV